ncbi:MAG TPA: acyl-CoA dehydrogenase family protein [Candidatus Acidoferrales bacterium]|jgi:acyl-CoA dehydrogenase|nr:acyl-CoA dehydrogenase family protein [Candidatus Acidoferrales bacterium]
MPNNLAWPFFDEEHRAFAVGLVEWLARVNVLDDERNADASCRAWVRALADAGWLRACIPGAYGGIRAGLDVRTLCLAREMLANHSALADFAFAMQGLGSAPIALFGSTELQRRYLPNVANGRCVAAFALSEREAGSDVAALATQARRDGDAYVIDGEKTWISNAGVADLYIIFARTSGDGARGLSAFAVDAGTAGCSVGKRVETISPHPLGSLRLERCRVPVSQRIGEDGEGFKIAMATLDVFRATVGAAALGFARRALAETVTHAKTRLLFGKPLGDLQMAQAAIAAMATDVDASALLVYRAGWVKDTGAARVTRESAMAKWFATEAAGRVCDRAVQLFGARGVVRGEIVERLYRDVRALRIYEGASEIQQIVIAKQTLEG